MHHLSSSNWLLMSLIPNS